MLRWCLPAVSAVGGRGCASLNIRASYSMRLASKLVIEERRSRPADDRVSLPRELATAKPGERVAYDTAASDEHSCPPGAASPSRTNRRRHLAVESAPSLPSRSLPLPEERPKQSSSKSGSRSRTSIQALQALLAPDNHSRPKPTVYTANTVRSIYRSAKASALLHQLTTSEFSALIGLFGTLSLSPPGKPYASLNAHPLATHIPSKAQAGRSYWPLVVELIGDKNRLFGSLSRSDHFYAMHARLGELQGANEQSEAELGKASLSLRNARGHYEAIRRSFNADVHLPFLNALVQHAEHVEEAIDTFCNVARRLPHLNTKLLDYLWRLIAASSEHAHQDSKTKLLRSLSSRARTALASSAPQPSPDTPIAPDDTHTVSIEDLNQSLSDVLACNTSIPDLTLRSHSHLLRWSLETVAAELSPNPAIRHSADVAWTHLSFLASPLGGSLAEIEALASSEDHGGLWSGKAVCILARIENVLKGKGPLERYDKRDDVELAAIRRVLKALWYKWSASQPREPRISIPVSGIIAACFLRIARRTGDLEFVERSWSFLRASGFFGEREVAAEYCTVMIGRGHDIRQIFLTILPHVPLASRSLVVQDVISQLLVDDLDLALKVYGWAKQSGIVVDSDVARELGMQVAASGNTTEAVHYLEDPGLYLEHKLDIVTVLLQCAVDPSQEFHSPELFVESINTLICTSDRPGMPPGGFEESLLAALMVRRHSWLPRIVATIQRSWPFFFSERFLTSAAEELVQQHQPRMALQLLRRGGLVGADVQDALVPQLLRAQAYKPAGSMLREPWPVVKPPALPPRLLNLLQTSRKRPARTLKVPALWSAATSPADVGLLAKALVRHVGPAKLALADAGGPVAAAHRTAIGNTLLHAAATRGTQAGAARVRHVLATFRALRDAQGFVPDRVTTNVLVGALLRWTAALDAPGVRALFDRMVRSGYPAGDACAPGATPFRTSVAEDGVQFEVPEVAEPIQYAAHVRPLYKMFVKALYLRGDAEGARVIVGILKGLEVKERMARVQRTLDSGQGGHKGKKGKRGSVS